MSNIRTGDIDFQKTNLRNLIKTSSALRILRYAEPGDVGDNRMMIYRCQFGQFFTDYLVQAWILQADRIDHPAVAFGDPRQRIAETRMKRGPLNSDRT
ncbi:hypothetical protein SDC9_199541 [bioreactor metagenome]|uniref:Uncharacterized protein n=1 Tax=bioreactor metagenome TaxID=1076179 RepID=A0A645IKS9_9ZZZZ